MKKIMIFAAALAVCGCSEDKIEAYSAANYVQFAETSDKEQTVSFVFTPTATELKAPLHTVMSGAPGSGAQEFKVEVVADETTAIAGTHYVMPAALAFPAGEVVTAPEITFKKTDDMDTKSYKLTLRLVPNANFELGEVACRTHTYVVHNMISRPEWWTGGVSTSVERAYFGKYSDAKFRLIIQVLGTGEMEDYTASEFRAATLSFKYWLEAQSPAIYDDANGEPMQVAAKG